MISFHKQLYFNIVINKNGKYTTEKGMGERLILLLENIETKYNLINQEERNTTTTYTGIKLKDIMPSLVFDVKQPTLRGKLSMLSLLYIDDLYRLSFLLFKEDIIKKYKEGNKLPLNKKVTIQHLNAFDKILFKNREFFKYNSETDEKEAFDYNYYELKLLGKPENNLQSLITNYTETDGDVMKVNGRDVNLDNIKEAIPRNSLCTCFVNLESLVLVSGKQLYITNKAYQIDVNRSNCNTSLNNNKTFDFKQHVKSMSNVEYHKLNNTSNNNEDEEYDAEDDNDEIDEIEEFNEN